MMSGETILLLAVFGVAGSLALLVGLLLSGSGRIESRLADLSPRDESGGLAQSASVWLPKIGRVLASDNESTKSYIQTRLIQAGFYRRHSAGVFLGTKLILMLLPVAVGALISAAGWLPLEYGVLYGALVGLAGTQLPGLWLSGRTARRRKKMRRALPDALDVIVICLEGGLSLPAAFARVSDELHAAYPLLASEMIIVRKAIELGRSTGEAFQDLADRFDADELRSMAVLIGQAERFGSSLVRTLRVQADGLRTARYQHAEAMAQKAPLKLIFPTVFCIFPALYIILMGPAGVQILEVIKQMSH
jgi:tight adherence protein C